MNDKELLDIYINNEPAFAEFMNGLLFTTESNPPKQRELFVPDRLDAMLAAAQRLGLLHRVTYHGLSGRLGTDPAWDEYQVLSDWTFCKGPRPPELHSAQTGLTSYQELERRTMRTLRHYCKNYGMLFLGHARRADDTINAVYFDMFDPRLYLGLTRAVQV